MDEQDCEDDRTLWLKFKAKLDMFDGEVSLLLKITDFVAESESLHSQKVQRVWRTLSRDNKKTVDGADGTLKTVNLASCRNLTDAAAQHLAQCPQLQTVNFGGCRNLTDAAAQHLIQRHPFISVDI